MTTSSENGRTAPADATELREEIVQTRAQLGETVEALAAKADVKARAQETVQTAKVRALESVDAAKLRVQEGVQQAAVNAAQVGRDLRDNPAERLRLTAFQARDAAARVGRSMAAQPGPWAVAAGMIGLVLFVASRKGRR